MLITREHNVHKLTNCFKRVPREKKKKWSQYLLQKNVTNLQEPGQRDIKLFELTIIVIKIMLDNYKPKLTVNYNE